jgi:hypothetical protein
MTGHPQTETFDRVIEQGAGRAERYRANTTQLRVMADCEPHDGFRCQLLELADRYEQRVSSARAAGGRRRAAAHDGKI